MVGEEPLSDAAEKLPVDEDGDADEAGGAAAVLEVASADRDAERGSLDATRECLNVRVGEGGCSERGCLPATEADDEDGEAEPRSMMLRRLVLCSDADRAAALSGDEAEGLGPLGDGDDFGSQASSSPRKEDGPSRPKSLAPGLVLLRLAGLNGSVNCVAETVESRSGEMDRDEMRPVLPRDELGIHRVVWQRR